MPNTRNDLAKANKKGSKLVKFSAQKVEKVHKLCRICLRKFSGPNGSHKFGFNTLPNGKRVVSRMETLHKKVL